jgi:GGDEF domain-containing protein
MSPSLQVALQAIESELKYRIHKAAQEAEELARDVKVLVAKTDEELQKAYNAIRASVGITEQEGRIAQEQEAQKARADAAMAAAKAQAEAAATPPTLTVVPDVPNAP